MHNRVSEPADESAASPERSRAELEEQRVAQFREIFRIDELQATRDPATYTDEVLLRTQLFYLSDFYRREIKPQCWNHFRRKALPVVERANDPEVLTGCERNSTRPGGKIARSRLLYYTFPAQERKLTPGDSLYDIEGERSFGSVYEINPDAGTLTIKVGRKVEEVSQLGLSRRPLNANEPLKKGLDRFLNALGKWDLSGIRDGLRRYPYTALVDIFLRDLPVFIDGPRAQEVSVGADDQWFREKLTDAALKLDRGYLFIQGLPGTRKTFHGARMSVSSIRAGKRLGVVSNSHKAIINFLVEVDLVAAREGVSFRGAKKSNRDDEPNLYVSQCEVDAASAQIHDYFDHEGMDLSEYDLIVGTAWTFCWDEHNQRFDYLIIDEASQLSLAHLAAAGVCARNLVLIGDPCQLSQPLRGIHPAGLDLSPLEFLLGEYSTVRLEHGVFLNWCRLIPCMSL